MSLRDKQLDSMWVALIPIVAETAREAYHIGSELMRDFRNKHRDTELDKWAAYTLPVETCRIKEFE